MYIIETDGDASRITVTFTGFLSMEEIESFKAELIGAVRALRTIGKQQTILYDYTDALIQSQEVIQAVKQFATENEFNSRKVALYSASQLAKSQARRIAEGNSHYGLFDDRAKAIAWLDTE